MNLKSLGYHFKEALLSKEPARIYFLVQFLKKYPFFSFKFRLDLDAILYPPYAYGMYCSALQARALGQSTITALKFGVAAGQGLLQMESYADQIKDALGVEFNIYGFDLGTGLPKSDDYRDQIYFWQEGDFRQDRDLLKQKLKNAEVIYGDVKDTVAKFFSNRALAPIGFIAFDLDFFSSTQAALLIFNSNEKNYLPRVECYFDDVNSSELLCASSETGVLRAISMFNEENKKKKILKKEGVEAFRRFPCPGWNNSMFIFHNFLHTSYNKHIAAPEGFQNSL